MKRNIVNYLVISLTLIVSSSCSSLLDEKTYTFVAGEDLVENGSYDQLVAGAFNTLHYSFEWGNYHNVVNFDTDYQSGPTWAFGSLGAGNFYEDGSNNNFYTNYYKSIHRANYHSYLINQMDIPQKVKDNAMGELAFLKAWAYFNLVQFYGDLCLYKTSISEGAPISIPRSPVKDVYEHIIELPKYAEGAMYSTHDAEYI